MTVIKLTLSNDTRRVTLTSPLTYSSLLELAEGTYGPQVLNLSFGWLDDEGDFITISSDRDITELLSSHRDGSVLKIHIKPRGEVVVPPSSSSTPHSEDYIYVGSTIDEHVPVAPSVVVIEANTSESPSVTSPPLSPPAAAAPTTEGSTSTLEGAIDAVLELLNLQGFKPLALMYMNLMRGSGDERLVYLSSVLTDPKFATILQNFKTSKSFTELQAAIQRINPAAFYLSSLDATDPFEAAGINSALLGELRTSLLAPLLAEFPLLEQYFPFITAATANESEPAANSNADGAAPADNVHHGFTCDGCGVHPIVGIRFKCKDCDNFDFCASCRTSNTTHDPAHAFDNIDTPIRRGGGLFGRRGGKRGGCGGGRGAYHHGGFFNPSNFFGGFNAGPCGGGRYIPHPTIPAVNVTIQPLIPEPSPAVNRSYACGPCPRSDAGCNVGCTGADATAGPTQEAKHPVPDEKTREAQRNEAALKAAIEESLRAFAGLDLSSAGYEESKSNDEGKEGEVTDAKVEKWSRELEALFNMGFSDADECIRLLEEKEGNVLFVIEALLSKRRSNKEA